MSLGTWGFKSPLRHQVWRSELAGLRWDDLDLVDATVTVRQVVVEAAGTLLVTEPKTAAPSSSK